MQLRRTILFVNRFILERQVVDENPFYFEDFFSNKRNLLVTDLEQLQV